MASMNANVLAMLKAWYKDGVENLLFRNSPVFGKIGKERVEGKSQNFAALAGFSGGVSGDYTAALANAAKVGTTAQWEVTPGQLFGAISFNNKEVLASKTNRGAFIKVADAKMFTSFDAIKKVLAVALYGRGFGEVCASGYSTEIVANTAFDITDLPESAMMSFVPGMVLDLKASIASDTVKTKLTINSANGTTINVTPSDDVEAPATTDILCISGSMDSAGNPLLPMGLAGWLPQVAARTGANWSTYADIKFFGVKRSSNQDALCGAYVDSTSTNESKSVTVQKLLRKLRRQGSKADLIVMNDEDFLALAGEIESTNTYFTQTSTKGKKSATVGFDGIGASFSTNYIENIYDDPFCPKGRFYILDSDTIKFWSYSNAEKPLDTGIAGNEAGTQTVEENSGVESKPYAMLIDDILSLQQGTAGVDGPTTVVGINVYGSYVVTNQAHNGVGNFYQASDIERSATA